jgi:hypothetical protein
VCRPYGASCSTRKRSHRSPFTAFRASAVGHDLSSLAGLVSGRMTLFRIFAQLAKPVGFAILDRANRVSATHTTRDTTSVDFGCRAGSVSWIWWTYLSIPGNSRASTSLVEAWISVPEDWTSPPTRRSRLPMTPAASPCLLTGIDGMIDQELVAGS